jgi:cell division transport system permease protein
MSLAAVTITTVTLLALGAVLVVAGTLTHIARHLEQQLEVAVYLRDGLTKTDIEALQTRLERLPGVTDLRYVSKGEALVKLQKTLGTHIDVRDLTARNPLPDSFVITADRPSRLPALASAALRLPQVEETSYGAKAVGRLLALTRAVRVGGTAAVAGLALVALIVITSTVRLTVFARRAEIEVMRLVGATAWFIRWPFIVEGALTGGCGALAAFVVVAAAYTALVHGARGTWDLLPLLSPGDVALAVFWKLSLWGILIGVLASLLAVRRYLHV